MATINTEVIYVGDIGTTIVLDCGVDITNATNTTIQCKKPDGTLHEWDAEIHTIDTDVQYIKYLTQEGDLNLAGRYKLQASITLDDWTGRGSTATLVVTPIFR